jgi:L-ascorbate metabolism protein UlaG (beta-lactamase superfamily)
LPPRPHHLTDPFLSEHASPLPPFGPDRFAPVRLPPIDVLLLPHNHYDHLDLPTVAPLSTRTGCRQSRRCA